MPQAHYIARQICYVLAMESSVCSTCQKTKAPLQCGCCTKSLCKSCAQILPQETLAFLQPCPDILNHGVYCGPCFNQHVAPAQEHYNEIMVRAENIIVFFKNQGKETRLIKRTEKPLRVTECDDREETLLRLAFLAAQNGFNGLIDVDIKAEKIFDHAYQTKNWTGIAMPVNLDPHRYAPEN